MCSAILAALGGRTFLPPKGQVDKNEKQTPRPTNDDDGAHNSQECAGGMRKCGTDAKIRPTFSRAPWRALLVGRRQTRVERARVEFGRQKAGERRQYAQAFDHCYWRRHCCSPNLRTADRRRKKKKKKKKFRSASG
jgi:hypothetical protein